MAIRPESNLFDIIDLEQSFIPMEGSQEDFLRCDVYECLYAGSRGCGKTLCLLMDFAKDVGKGYGMNWRGILFRQTYVQLYDVVIKSLMWFKDIFPDAKFNSKDYVWKWKTGEELRFAYIKSYKDYYVYHGHEYTWIGFEELTNWENQDVYDAAMTLNRSPHPDIPKRIRSTCNPWGPGHEWVKERFVDPAPPKTILVENGIERVLIQGHLKENEYLMKYDPDYAKRMAGIKDEVLRKAWWEGSWDIVAGGFFRSVWRPDLQILTPFTIPDTWDRCRSFDWGHDSPASLGFWAISDGNAVIDHGGKRRIFPKGSLIRYKEVYFAKRDAFGKVKNRGLKWDNAKLGRAVAKASAGEEFEGCVAGHDTFAEKGGQSMYEQMRAGAKEIGEDFIFEMADTERIPGWQRVKMLLAQSAKEIPEAPGMWVFDICRDWIRTMPLLMRDEKKPDDVDTKMEDHIADETRYMAMKSIEQTYEEDFLL